MNNGVLIISVADKSFGIRFGMQAMMGISADGVFDANEALNDGTRAFVTAASITKMAWHGYLNWCLWMDQKPEYNRQDFLDLLDSAILEDANIYSKIIELFQESKMIKTSSSSEKKIQKKNK